MKKTIWVESNRHVHKSNVEHGFWVLMPLKEKAWADIFDEGDNVGLKEEHEFDVYLKKTAKEIKIKL